MISTEKSSQILTNTISRHYSALYKPNNVMISLERLHGKSSPLQFVPSITNDRQPGHQSSFDSPDLHQISCNIMSQPCTLPGSQTSFNQKSLHPNTVNNSPMARPHSDSRISQSQLRVQTPNLACKVNPGCQDPVCVSERAKAQRSPFMDNKNS